MATTSLNSIIRPIFRFIRYNETCRTFVPKLSRGYKRSYKPFLMEMKKRSKLYKTPTFPRSAWVGWNREAELYAFQQRLNESFKDEELNIALTHKSYVEEESRKRSSLSVEENEILHLPDNSKYIESGEKIMSKYIQAFLRFSLPYLPEEGICNICESLVTVDQLSYIGSNIGLKDIVLCQDFPVEKETLSDSFKAITGLIHESQDIGRTENFIRDFVITQLIDKDVNALWNIVNPMGHLCNILKREGKSEPESRIIRESGRKTIFAVYFIGIYVDKKLIGEGCGETLEIAEEMASRDALKRMFKSCEKNTPFPYQGHPKLNYDDRNLSIEEWTSEKADQIAAGKLPQQSSSFMEI